VRSFAFWELDAAILPAVEPDDVEETEGVLVLAKSAQPPLLFPETLSEVS
jgi:hypothetical protein